MKQHISIIIIILAFAEHLSFSQQHLLGVEGGVTISSINSREGSIDPKSRTYYNLGISYELRTISKYSFKFEIKFKKQGFSHEVYLFSPEGVSLGKYNMIDNYNYLSFPIKVGYSVGNKLLFIPSIGLNPSYLIKAEESRPLYFESGEWLNIYDRVRHFDIGGIFDLQLSYLITQHLEIKSNLSFSHSFINSDIDRYASRIMHKGLLFSLGINYRLHKNNRP